MRSRHLLPVLLIAASSCSDPTAARNDLLLARAMDKEVLLENRTSTPVVAVIFEQQILEHINFAFCATPVSKPTDCGAIQPGETGHVPNTSIYGYRRGANAVVLNARLTQDSRSGYYIRGDLQPIVVQLR